MRIFKTKKKYHSRELV